MASPDPERLSQDGASAWSAAARRRLLRRFAADYLGDYVRPMGLTALAMLGYSASIVMLPTLFERLVDRVLVGRDAAALQPLIALVLGVFLLRAASSFTQQYALAYVGNAVTMNLQRRIADHLLSLDVSFFHKNSVGQLISRATDDVQVLNRSATSLVIMLGRDLVTLIGLLGYIFWSNPLWFVFGLVCTPLFVVPIGLANRRMRTLSRRAQNLAGDILQALEEALHAIRAIKAEHLEDLERRRLGDIIAGRRKVALRLARTQALVLPVADLVTALALVTVILFGGGAVIRGQADPGQLIAFASALLLVYDPLRRVLQLNSQLQTSVVSLHRIYEVLDRRAAIVDRPGAAALRDPGGAIRFEDVTFSYGADAPVLRGFTLEVPAGATAAFVGSSGAGKTTIFNLLARLYEPQGGRITIGGQDIAAVALPSLRSNLALVSQDILLFDAPVGENLRYGLDGADPGAVRRATEAAEASAFIGRLPDGEMFRVGPRGSRLSGGQRQRVAIARALLRDKPILLLDEASAALDSDSEANIQASLARSRQGRTTLVIAHRLASIMRCDVIFVVEAGRIVEAGSHPDLLARGGAYARLVARQLL